MPSTGDAWFRTNPVCRVRTSHNCMASAPPILRCITETTDMSFDPAELGERAKRYAEMSRDDLLLELNNLVQPVAYATVPTDEEKKNEGRRLWLQMRPRLARLICANRERRGGESIGALIAAGGGAFVTEVAEMILGSGVLPGVTAAIAAAAAGLLYKELQGGLDEFCDAYHVAESP
jgi:hypothetical protein